MLPTASPPISPIESPVPSKRLNVVPASVCSEIVDLTAAKLAPDMLTLVKMGDPGLLAATEVVKSGMHRVSKPVKLKAPITGVGKIVCIGMN